MDAEEFRLDRVGRMGQVSDDLFQHVDDAQAETIGGEEMALALEPWLQEAFRAEYLSHSDFANMPDPAAAWRWTWQRIRPGIVAASDLADPRTIANWLGTAIVNAARVVGGDRRGKTWLSRRDDKVRPFHVEADGQTVKWNEPFVVCDGRELDFPGQPVGEPSCWINCRCVAMPVPNVGNMTAAGDGSMGSVIVAIPADDDGIWNASSEPKPHMTVIWLGDSEVTDLIREAVAVAAASIAPETAPVTSRETLGDDEADVVMMNPGSIGTARDLMMNDPNVRAAHDAVEQYPQWTPHVTLGYPDNPALGEPGKAISFDRLAVWDGDYAGEEYPMTAMAPEEPLVGETPVDMEEVPATSDQVPWYGVLAPEGIASGDGRRFSEGALEWRELPIPLLWQEKSGMGHEGSVVVGQISSIWKEGNLVWASGHFAETPAADQVIGLLAEGHLRGVSVDVDSAEMSMEDEDSDEILFNRGRISAATVVPIPAFAEAFVALGVRNSERSEPEVEIEMANGVVAMPLPFISEEPWDGSASRFSPEQWKSSCCLHVCDGEEKSCHKLPIKEPGGALSRAGVHAAAARLNQVDAPPEAKSAAKGRLRSAYQDLGEEPPDVVKSSAERVAFADAPGLLKDGSPPQCSFCQNPATGYVIWAEGMAFVPYCDDHYDVPKYAPDISESDIDRRGEYAFNAATFARGPGWVTDPVATRRIHDYWTVPGHEGYAKIAWGTPGDFRRLRAYLSKYLTPQYLNRTTAQWHHDALGYWPGEKGLPGNPPYGADIAPALTLVAAGGWCAPSEWFLDPALEGPTPLTVSDDGRVLGHLATWDTCHIGIPGTCTTAPHSASNYAYFCTGVVATDAGDVRVGQITMATGHAPLSAGAHAAASHYDNTGTVVADVIVGEDQYGIWVAGCCRPDITDAQRAGLRAGALSGDWRSIRGALELVAALVVNVPGFPIPRTGLAASGVRQASLVAAGVVPRVKAVLPEMNAELPDLIHKAVVSYAQRSKRADQVLADMRRIRAARLLADMEV